MRDPEVDRFFKHTSFYGQVAEIDNQGRLLIHPRLREKAAMAGEVSVVWPPSTSLSPKPPPTNPWPVTKQFTRYGQVHNEFDGYYDWMHHGEGLQLFHRMNLSLGADPLYATRARRFAGFYTGEDPEAPNYDPKLKVIRSMQNGMMFN